ncbi:MAG TPA: hypothetical protein VLF89_00855 [Candidatus Saccharimonadales bacterium]|nr:hypothetical protein [Candidatus Saccharimonadales bacterium]
MFKKISFKGIILGGIADVVGSNIWGVILVIYLLSRYHLYSLPQTKMIPQLQHLISQDPIIFILNLFVGGGFTVLGGYIAARIAKHDELLNGTLASFLCVLFALFAIGSTPILNVLLAVLANPLLGFAGGYLQLKQKKKVKNKIIRK